MTKRGFTLTELLVVIAIIGVLATMLAPVVGTSIDKARVAKMVALTKTLESACDAFYSDTSTYAYEYVYGTYYTATTYHRLAYNSAAGITGWSGPYIKRPLNAGDNPFGYYMYLYNSLSYALDGGFDLNGDDTVEKTGAGNYLQFYVSSQAIAQRFDDIIDKGMGTTNWQTRGAVKFSGGATGGTVYIYITGG
jgi:prepilin-type N-terminal cleavage/methylation domain-containing protein